ncbi:MAG: Hsp20/alpha crystallin family protein [Oscillospiraceae bacterium]|nr:Hsp20/alpha crystallin family protein [Oscillospiraceae bacterium]
MFRITPYRTSALDFTDIFRDFEKEFFGSAPQNTCRTDIREENGVYFLDAEMPGFDKEDIKIDIEDGLMTLSAEHKSENEEKAGEGSYIRRERRFGSFKRSFNIENVEAEKIEAAYKNGVLTVTMPKKGEQETKARRLEIH